MCRSASKLLRLALIAGVVGAVVAGCASASSTDSATSAVAVTASSPTAGNTTIVSVDPTVAPTASPSNRMDTETAAAVEECIVGLSSYAMGDYSVEYQNTRSFLEPGIEKCNHTLALLDARGLSGGSGSLWDVISVRNHDTQAFADKITAGSATDADGVAYDDASSGFYDHANALANDVR